MTHNFLREIALDPSRIESMDGFPYTIPAVRQMGKLSLDAPVTIFVGENGSGKSTLLEALALKVGLNAEGGTRNFRGSTRPSESNLHQGLRMVRGTRRERTSFFLRAETMYNVSTEAEALGSYGWESLHEMSHGEGFLWVAMNRFHSDGLYLLDEPEAALSPQRQLSLLVRMHQLVAEGSQFVISTHSPILMAYPDAVLYHLDEAGIRPIEFEETEHFQVTRSFRRMSVLDNLYVPALAMGRHAGKAEIRDKAMDLFR